jgi:hypothetical protein
VLSLPGPGRNNRTERTERGKAWLELIGGELHRETALRRPGLELRHDR